MAEHDRSEHPPSGYQAPPSRVFGLSYEGGSVAPGRMFSQIPQPHPLTRARSFLDDAVPLLTGDPGTTAETVGKSKPKDWEELNQLSDRELLRKCARELAIVGILVSRELRNQISSLMPPQKFLELTFLAKALSVCYKTACEVLLQAIKMPASSPPQSKRDS